MNPPRSYSYIALIGNDFDPNVITHGMGIDPTRSWKTGDKGEYKPVLDHSGWELHSDKVSIGLDEAIETLTDKLADKIDVLCELKRELDLSLFLRVVLEINLDEEEPTPVLTFGHKTIEFLHLTGTTVDVDIYRFDSSEDL